VLDVRRMRVLLEVGRRGSFSAAAEALSYTQSAVSQQVAALEREAGTRLVERGGRGVRLTQAGEAVARHAEAILARLADAEAELEAIAGLRGGRLRLASFPTAGSTLMPKAIADFRTRHPGVELSLADAEAEESIARLRAGELDLALIQEPNEITERGGSGIERTHLLDDPMFLVLPGDHPLAGRARVRLRDLAEEAWVNTPGWCACSRLVMSFCARAGIDPHIAFETDDYLAVQGLVAAGVGVALIPELALATVRDDVAIRSLDRETPTRQVIAGTLEGAYRSPATAAMLGILSEVADEHRRRRDGVPRALAV
jgi:DNA-binding transcriptional LysR family regulator